MRSHEVAARAPARHYLTTASSIKDFPLGGRSGTPAAPWTEGAQGHPPSGGIHDSAPCGLRAERKEGISVRIPTALRGGVTRNAPRDRSGGRRQLPAAHGASATRSSIRSWKSSPTCLPASCTVSSVPASRGARGAVKEHNLAISQRANLATASLGRLSRLPCSARQEGLASAPVPLLKQPCPHTDLVLADEALVRVGLLDGPGEYLFSNIRGRCQAQSCSPEEG